MQQGLSVPTLRQPGALQLSRYAPGAAAAGLQQAETAADGAGFAALGSGLTCLNRIHAC
jgi:hypothetical protein